MNQPINPTFAAQNFKEGALIYDQQKKYSCKGDADALFIELNERKQRK
jgi:hypothetical protein